MKLSWVFQDSSLASCKVYLKVGMCPGEQTDTSNLPQTRFWMKTFVYLSLPYVIFRCSCSNVDTAVQLHTKLQRIGDEESFKAPQNYADCRAIYYHICALFWWAVAHCVLLYVYFWDHYMYCHLVAQTKSLKNPLQFDFNSKHLRLRQGGVTGLGYLEHFCLGSSLHMANLCIFVKLYSNICVPH